MRNAGPWSLDFVYVGTPRAGSTWLAGVLDEHPQVYVPHNKELHFFNDRHISGSPFLYPKGMELYRSYFADAPTGSRSGDISPYYYYDPNAAARLAREFPHVKIIAFLRNPVDMLASLYRLLRQRERRAATFEQELALRPHWLDLGFYHRLLQPYFDHFPPEQIYVGIHEHFFADEATNLRDLLSFLDVDPTFRPSLLGQKINVSSDDAPNPVRRLRGLILQLLQRPDMLPVKRLLHQYRLNRVHYTGVPKADAAAVAARVSAATRHELLELFAPDIRRLERQLGIELNIWLDLPEAVPSRIVPLRPYARGHALPGRLARQGEPGADGESGANPSWQR